MLIFVLAHAVAAVVVPWASGPRGRAALCAAALVPAATAGWAIARAGTVIDGGSVGGRLAWATDLGLTLDFRLDGLALSMLLLVGIIGALVFVYSAWYFTGEPRPRLVIGTLVAFPGAMAGLVLADNLFALYVFWELTTICSYLLIGGAHPEDEEARRAASRALIMTAAAGLVMLGGFVILGQQAGTYEISAIVADPPRGAATTVALVLVLIGAFTKSAQVPLHSWLPAAMVAPTPVSAYLHAAAMVKAGVYLVARLAPAFAEVGFWTPLIVSVGLLSMLVGGLLALAQKDLKRLLAFGTVSQLGLLMVLFGAGTRTAALAGVALLLAHGAFKAPMFLAVGVLDRVMGTRHTDRLAGAGRHLPVVAVASALAVASMVGLPPLLGLVAKEAALEAFAHGGAADLAVLAGVVAGAVLTVAYGCRFLAGAFGGTAPGDRPRPPGGMVAPVAILAAAGLAAGPLAGELQKLFAPYAGTLPGGGSYKLALWHGLGVPPALTAFALAAGLGLHLAGDRLPTISWPRPRDVYAAAVRGLFALAHAVTGTIQVGSLPVYLMVIVIAVPAVPGGYLLAHPGDLTGSGSGAGSPRLWDSPVQAVLAVIVVAAAIAALRARRRLSAVVLLGAVGYGVVGLFVVHGAPDLALTLAVVETLSLIMFVFLLRRLPERFPPRRRPPWSRAGSAAVSILLGAFVGGFLLVATMARDGPAVGPVYTETAAKEGFKNVVNMILVDFRGLDTLGEIAVLAATIIGVVGLVLEGSGRPRPAERAEVAPFAPRGRWLADPGTPPLGERSVALEVTARYLTPTIVVFSIYLLFAGHNGAGGGFVGGLVAATAYILRYIAGGPPELAAALPVRPTLLVGSGLLLSAAAGAAGWLTGGSFLENAELSADLPVVGHLHLPTNLVFDLGVYLLVLGLVGTVATTLGASLDAGGARDAGDGAVAAAGGDGR